MISSYTVANYPLFIVHPQKRKNVSALCTTPWAPFHSLIFCTIICLGRGFGASHTPPGVRPQPNRVKYSISTSIHTKIILTGYFIYLFTISFCNIYFIFSLHIHCEGISRDVTSWNEIIIQASSINTWNEEDMKIQKQGGHEVLGQRHNKFHISISQEYQ